MRKSSFSKTICIVCIFCIATAIASPAQTFTTFSFDGSDGGSPSSALVQGTDGGFYGTTSIGGGRF